jgi:peptidoglycan hydrolase-like protein with peptidoglycan-binding domain
LFVSLAASGLLLSVYALREALPEATSHQQAQSPHVAVVVAASASNVRSSSQLAEASAGIDPRITASSQATTTRRIPQATAYASDFTVDTDSHSDFALASLEREAGHAASPTGDADTQAHAGLETVDEARVSALSLDRFDPNAARGDLASALVWAAQASAKAPTRPVMSPLGDTDQQPLMLVVSLRDQRLDVYRGASLLASAKVSSGKPGYDTRTGVFSILEKKRFHHSNLYSNAPMPWMQRLTRSGTALHAGVIPGYPASHGCIRLPFSFAPKLFEMTAVGGNVVIADDRIAPSPIEHPLLFQPAASRVVLPAPAQAPNAVGLAQNGSGVASIIDSAYAGDAMLMARVHAVDPIGEVDPEAGAAKATANSSDRANVEPLRILVTRQTERDRIIAVQNMLASMGYLERQRFTGKLGAATSAAIKAFQKANGLRETGGFTDEIAKLVYAAAGITEPPAGHIFVRQDFQRVFDAPVEILDAGKPLGTHALIAAKGDAAELQWFALSVDGDDSAAVLDRIVMPPKIREAIERRLGPGAALIISEIAVDSAILPEGDDFLVLAKSAPSAVAAVAAKAKPVVSANKPPKIKKVTQSAPKRRSKKVQGVPPSRPYRYPSYGFGGLFSRW